MTSFSLLLNRLIDGLTERQRDIIVNRFGLMEDNPQTLAAIGKRFDVTRERVRQIEAGTLILLAEKLKGEKELASIVDQIHKTLEKEGGAVKADEFVNICRGIFEEARKSHMHFLARVSGKFHFSEEDEAMRDFYYLDSKSLKQAAVFISKLAKFLENKKSQILSGNGLEILRAFAEKEDLSENQALHFVDISKKFHKNCFGDFGLAEWPEVHPQSIRDKIYLILKKKNKPLHFREITNLINSMGIGRRTALVPTVHNELIKDPRFVLVGRGVYALEESGYTPGTAREVIVRLLSQKGALTPEEIVFAVQKERLFKPNTVIANLQNKQFFERLPGGRYQVKES